MPSFHPNGYWQRSLSIWVANWFVSPTNDVCVCGTSTRRQNDNHRIRHAVDTRLLWTLFGLFVPYGLPHAINIFPSRLCALTKFIFGHFCDARDEMIRKNFWMKRGLGTRTPACLRIVHIFFFNEFDWFAMPHIYLPPPAHWPGSVCDAVS